MGVGFGVGLRVRSGVGGGVRSRTGGVIKWTWNKLTIYKYKLINH